MHMCMNVHRHTTEDNKISPEKYYAASNLTHKTSVKVKNGKSSDETLF